jgi:hypothetical protein
MVGYVPILLQVTKRTSVRAASTSLDSQKLAGHNSFDQRLTVRRGVAETPRATSHLNCTTCKWMPSMHTAAHVTNASQLVVRPAPPGEEGSGVLSQDHSSTACWPHGGDCCENCSSAEEILDNAWPASDDTVQYNSWLGYSKLVVLSTCDTREKRKLAKPTIHQLWLERSSLP